MPAARSCLAVLALVGLTAAATADEPSAAAKKLADKLAAEQTAFDAAQKKAKQRLVKALGEAAAAAVQADPTALGRDKQKTLQAEREAFDKRDILPTSDEALGGLYAYLNTVHEARAKLRRAADALVNQLGKDGDATSEAKAKAERAKLDASAPGQSALAVGSRWNGTLQKQAVGPNANNTTFGLTVEKLGEGTIYAFVALNNGWCKMRMEGLRDGPYFVLKVKEKVIGDAGQPVFTGFVCGDRLVVEVAGIVQQVKVKGRGKVAVPVGGFATLSPVKKGG